MIKSILSRLNGHAIEPSALSEALAQLARDRAATEAEITLLNAKRRQALLDDASDEVLDKLERQIDRANVKLEKLTIAEQPLREQLATATAAERRRRWDAHVAAHRTATDEFLVAARTAAAKHAALGAVAEQARREGFEAEVQTWPATPNVAGNLLAAPDLLDQFERAMAPRTITVKSPAPHDVPVPRAATRQPTLQHAVRIAGGVPLDVSPGQRLTASRDPDDTAPLEAGEARVRVLRSGYSPSDDRPQATRGQLLRMPRSAAEKAASAGVIEILE